MAAGTEGRPCFDETEREEEGENDDTPAATPESSELRRTIWDDR